MQYKINAAFNDNTLTELQPSHCCDVFPEILYCLMVWPRIFRICKTGLLQSSGNSKTIVVL